MKKRHLWTRHLLSALLVTASACRSRPSTRDAGVAVQLPRFDAGSPHVLLLVIEATLSDGGVVREPLDTSNSALLPPTQALEVTANLPLHNYRLRILDELDRALASDDTPEETGTGLHYHIALVAPQRSGHRYTVQLDAQSGATFDDGSGVALNEMRLEFRTEGERGKDLPAKRTSKRHHHRGNGT
jgi:hypothetical protein